jgi:Cytosolic carboxypeptidase N-terminal domain
LNEYPSRSVNTFPDSKIIIRSDFCSGNLSKALRGNNKNCFDLWVASDSEPHFKNTDFYRTWFYFSITGVPSGEQLTFTFRNLHNQVINILVN